MTSTATAAATVVVTIDQTAFAAADVFKRMSMNALVADVRDLDRQYALIGGTLRAARELGKTELDTVLDDVAALAHRHSVAGGFFVYRGGNHVAIHSRSGADRAILFTTPSHITNR